MATLSPLSADGVISLPLVLGTAQLGMEYGIANRTGMPTAHQATAIVHEALRHGVATFDTAQAYGNSEAVLGTAIAELGIVDRVRIISKLSPRLNPADGRQLQTALNESRARLGVASFYGLLLHSASWLQHLRQELGSVLRKAVAEGLVQRLGVSVYTVDEAMAALRHPEITLVQMPFNLFDQSAHRRNFFTTARQRVCTVHVRSVFLQGLLLMEPEAIPVHLAGARPMLTRLSELARETGLSRNFLACAYAYHRSAQSPLVVGAETAAQVRENCAIMAEVRKMAPGQFAALAAVIEEELQVEDPFIINPAKWQEARA